MSRYQPKQVKQAKNCKAISKKSKKPCKGNPLNGFEYCKIHLDQAETTTSTSEDNWEQNSPEKAISQGKFNPIFLPTQQGESLKESDEPEINNETLEKQDLATDEKKEENYSEDDDFEDTITGQEALPDEDQQPADDDYDCDEDQYNHLQDVHGVDSRNAEEMSEPEAEVDEVYNDSEEEIVETFIPVAEWSWELNTEERWTQAHLLEQKYKALLARINEKRNGAIKANPRRLHDQKTDYHSRKQGLSPLSDFQALKDKPGMDEDEEQDKKKSHKDCTIYLCQMIKRIHKMEAFFNDENKPEGEEDDVQSNADSLYSFSAESNKEKNTTDLWDELFSNESLQGVDLSMSDIAKLCEYIQHYKISVPEIIYQWINGFRPKLKCKTDDCMSTVFTNNYKFCDKHLCLFNKDVSATERCKFPRLTEHLCAQHACQYEECTGVKLPGPQIYCNEHACFVCIKENKIAQKSEDEPPRNTCRDHVLCFGLTDNSWCQNLAVNRTPFCLDHAFPICRSKDKNGKACKNYASSRGVAFCDLHKPKPVAQPKQVKQAKNCKAISKKSKKPCKGNPLNGFEYCKIHLDQAETTTSTSEDDWEQNSPEKAISQGKFNPIFLPTQQGESLKESDEPEINNETLEKQDLATDEKKEENYSEDDDFEDTITGQEALPDEDQQPADDDYDCDEDQYNHLQDVHGVDSRNAEEMSEPEAEVDEVYNDSEEEIVETFIPVAEWSWELNTEERWTQAHLLEQKYKALLARINEKRNGAIKANPRRLHDQKTDYHSRKQGLSPLSDFQALKDKLGMDEDEEQDKKKAHKDCTIYLCQMIKRIHKMEAFFNDENKPEGEEDDVQSNADSLYSFSAESNKEKNTTDLWDELFSNESLQGVDLSMSDIAKLCEYIQHYKISVPEIIYQWINGFSPKPKCKTDDCMSTAFTNNYKFCDKHLCLFNKDVSATERCKFPRLTEHLCAQHACQYEECTGVKLPGPQIYCNEHACFVCIKENKIAQKSEDEPPRNTCLDHVLCAGLTDNSSCQNLAVNRTPFCLDHAFPICRSKDKNGKACKNYASSRGVAFCDLHKPKPVAQPKQVKQAKNCKAISKKSKKPCKGNPLNGFEYCKIHLDQAETTTSTSEDDWEQNSPEKAISQGKFNPIFLPTQQGESLKESDEPEINNETLEKQDLATDEKKEENYSEDDDFEDTITGQEALPDEDQQPADDDYDCDEDQYNHLQDVHGVDSRNAEEMSEPEAEVDEVYNDSEEEIVETFIPVAEWSWELNTEERWTQAHLLEQKYKALLARINEKRNGAIKANPRRLHDQKTDYHSRKQGLSPLSDFQALKDKLGMDEDEEQDKKKAHKDCTIYLCQMIKRIHKMEAFFNDENKPEGEEDDVQSNADSLYSFSAESNKEKNTTDLWDELFSNESLQGVDLSMSDIAKLCEYIQHYKISVPEIIYQWINGFSPKPKCKTDDCMSTAFTNNYKFCDKHLCLFNKDVSATERCKFPRLTEHLCAQHACQYEECTGVKLPGPQIYCNEHACFVCIKENKIAQKSEDEPPRNTCLDHVLCAGLTDNSSCQNLAVNRTPFCLDHAFPICRSKDKNGKACKNYASSRGVAFCDLHKPKPVAQPKQVKQAKNCKAISKKSKKPCKGNPLNGFEYCKIHLDQAETTTSTSEDDWEQNSPEKAISQGKFNPIFLPTQQGESLKESDEPEINNETLEKQDLATDEKKEENYSEDDDFEDTITGQEALPDEDQQPADDDYDCDEDQYNHLQDVHGVDSRNAEEMSEPEAEVDEVYNDSEEEIVETFIPVAEWSWELNTEERWTQAHLLEQKYKALLARINEKRNGAIKANPRRLHDQKTDYHSRKQGLSPLSDFQALKDKLGMDEDEEQDKKKAHKDCTIYLCQMIKRIHKMEAFFNDENKPEGEEDDVQSNADSLYSFSAESNKEKNTTDLWDELFSNESLQGVDLSMSDIAKLCEYIQHYKISVPEIIYQWINGFSPKPKCKTDDCMSTAFTNNYKFCDKHLCLFNKDVSATERCKFPRLTEHLCAQHACQYEECTGVKLPGPQIYCNEHACFVCIKENKIAQKSEDEPPRNTCRDHVLCFGLTDNSWCQNLAVNRTPFCLDHAFPICRSKDKNGKACKNYASSRGVAFCDLHKPKPVAQPKQVKQAKNCKAISKKSKKPCKGNPLNGFEYCKIHLDQAETTTSTSEDDWEQNSPEKAISQGKFNPIFLPTQQGESLKESDEPEINNETLEKQDLATDEKKEENYSEDDDFEDTITGQEALPDEDQQPADDDYDCDEDQYNHLQDVHGVDSRNAEEMSEPEAEVDEVYNDSEEEIVETFIPVAEWSWELNTEERWTQAHLLEQKYKALLARINEKRNGAIKANPRRLHDQKTDYHSRKQGLSPLSDFQALKDKLGMDEDEEQDKKKAHKDCTIYLCQMIKRIHKMEAFFNDENKPEGEEDDVQSNADSLYSFSAESNKEKNTTDLWDELFSNESLQGVDLSMSDIAKLCEYIQHYKISVPEIIYQWINGFSPKPKCKTDDCMSTAFTNNYKFCDKHLCLFNKDVSATERCKFPRLTEHLCAQHACQYEECTGVKLPGPQIYCNEHACFVCIKENKIAQKSEDEPPRNTCRDHVLCFGLTDNSWCQNLAVNRTPFCLDHAFPICRSKDKNGKACKNYASSRGVAFCDLHKPKPVAQPKQVKQAKNCKAISKKSKKPCKGNPLNGFEYCKIHLDQAETTTSTSEDDWEQNSPEKAISQGKFNPIFLPTQQGESLKESDEPEINNETLEKQDLATDEKKEENYSEDDDFEDTITGQEALPDEDQQPADDDYDCDEDQYNHLQDVHGVDSRNAEEMSEPEAEVDEVYNDSEEEIVETFIPVAEWSWELNTEERWTQAHLLEQKYKALLARINEKRNGAIKANPRRLHDQKTDYHSRKQGLSPLSDFQALKDKLGMDEDEEQDKKKAHKDCTIYLCQMIKRIHKMEAFFNDENKPEGEEDDVQSNADSLYSFSAESNKEKNTTDLWDELFSNESLQGVDLSMSDIAKLCEYIQHYKISVPEIIYQWINGFSPKPKCKTDDCMSTAFTNNYKFCDKHLCLFNKDVSATERCKFPRLTEHLCAQHACQYEECTGVKLPGPQIYCNEHACFVCIKENKIAQKSEDEPPRNTCRDHVLCFGLTDNSWCQNLAVNRTPFCLDHAFPICRSKDKNGKACINYASSRGVAFCDLHKPKPVAQPKQVKQAKNCKAISKKSKKPCKGNPLNGFEYCKIHLDQAETTTSTSEDDWEQNSPEKAISQGKFNPIFLPTQQGESLKESDEPEINNETLEKQDLATDEKKEENYSEDDDFEDTITGQEALPDEDQQPADDDYDCDEDQYNHLQDVHGVDSRNAEEMSEPEAEVDEVYNDSEEEIVETFIPVAEWSWELNTEERWTQAHLLEQKYKALLARINEKRNGAIKANPRRLHDQKTDYHSRKQGLSPLSDFQALKDKLGMDEDEEQDKKKAHKDCTIYLCQMIKRIHKMEAFFNDENKPEGEEDDVQSNADSLYSFSAESNKEKNTTDLWDELFSNESLQGVDLSMSDIAKLCEYIQHYKISVPEIIYQWINGFSPKPKCKTDDCMSTAFTNNYKFCDKHLCLFNKDVSATERCKFPRLTEHLCAQHACQYEECTGVKLPGPQIYCNEHACFVCIKENKIAQKSEDEPPRNTCRDHVLCFGLTDNSWCQNLAVNRTPFCLDHAFPICRSKDKNGKACKNYASSRGVAFCDLHKPKPVAQPKQVKQAKNCKAISKKSKKPCKGNPLNGFEYCKIHLDQAETTTSTSEDDWEQNSPEKAISQGKFNPIFLPTQQGESLKESDEPEINNETLEKQDLATDEKKEENYSEDDDFEDTITGQEALPDEDQQPADDDYDCDEDQYNHLQDVHGVDSRNAEEMSEPEAEVDEVYNDSEEEIVETFIPVAEWSWELNTEERWTQAHLLEQKYKALLARINEKRNGAIKANPRRLHDQKTDYHSRKQGLSPLSDFQALKDKLGMDEDEEQDKKKAHKDCTIYLCQMIKRIHKMEAFFNDENKPEGEEDDVQSNADSLYSFSAESNKEKNTTDLWDELFSNESLQGVDLSMSDIAKLCEYIQHYKISVPEIIYQWINGFSPKPKCKTDDCMSTAFTNNYKFCDKHLCLFNKDVSATERCKFPRLTEHLCAQHACQYEECTGVKLPGPQIYCNEHACFVCIKENKIAQKSEDEPPRNTCLDHVLCAGLTDNSSCQNLAVNRTPFCLDHAFPICRSKDKNGKACKNYASSRGVAFCDLHKPKPVAQPKQVKQAKNCKAISKKCKEKLIYTPACGHSIKVDCFLKQQYEKKEVAFQCVEKVEVVLPRFGHDAVVSCDKEQQLRNWKGERCPPGLVREGQNYGPTDHRCDEMVDFERKCGHIEKLKCQDAFEQARFSGICSAEVQVVNPECGHEVMMKCHQKQQYTRRGILINRKPVQDVHEGQSANIFGKSVLHEKCQQAVTYIRKCGHQAQMKCCEARDEHVKACVKIINVQNKLCDHTTFLPCHLADEMNAWKPWPSGKSPLSGGVLSDAHEAPVLPHDELSRVAFNCSQAIKVEKKTCKHIFEMNCNAAMKNLGKNLANIKCKAELKQALLKCGHTLDFVCWEYEDYKQNPSQIQCKEKVFLTCWNHKACRQLLQSTCNMTSKLMQCKERTEWSCEKGHKIKDAICQRGLPSHCPECDVGNIEIHMETLKNLKQQKKGVALPDLPAGLKNLDPVEITNANSESAFLDAQLQVLTALKTWTKNQKSSNRPMYTFSLIPCFRYNHDEKFSTDFSTYMKAGTMHGTQVYEWTLKNVEQMIKSLNNGKKRSTGAFLLMGFVFCCRILVDPKDYPSNKYWEKQNWVSKQREQKYFAVQTSRDNWDSIIAWDPYPMIATHKIWIKVSDLQKIASQMKNANPPVNRAQLAPKFLKFYIPEKACSYVVSQAEKEELEDETNEAEEHRGEVVNDSWDGVSLGNSIGERAQKELVEKLQFCSKLSKSAGSDDPFSGLKCLKHFEKKLKKQKTEFPEIHLLKALEHQHMRNFAEANDDLSKYLIKLSEHERHPLSLIAQARQSLHEDKTSDDGRDILLRFANTFPQAVVNWLSEAEIALLKDEDESQEEATVVMTPLKRWEQMKQEEGVVSEEMDNLMKLTGLRKVKKSAFDIFKAAYKFSMLPPEVQKKNPKTLNFCFLGNAGSGKTTVARKLAAILKDSGARPAGTFVETSAQKLKDGGADEFRKMAKSAEGGVLFIDEAFDLDPKGDFKGKPIVSELLVIAENQRDKLSIFLAGYEDDMNSKLFSFSEGIKSRFEIFNFKDFNETELLSIWEGELKERNFQSDDRAGLVVSKRLHKCAGRKGFGNARAVRKEVEKAINNCMGRDDFDPNHLFIMIEDVMGESPLNNPTLKDVLREIDEKIGWTSIKKSVDELLEICKRNYEKQLLGKKTSPIMLNRLFLGNPGTGKTTCAELYGRLLKELGILSVGDVVMCAASDLVGSHVGESQKKTNEMIEKARGKVLVIDEAYSLNDGMYGKQALDTIVEKVQNTESDDIAVLMLGYEKQMRQMLREQNPGLARRFSSDNPFIFVDYTQKELLDILNLVCKKENILLSSEVSEKIIHLLEKQKSQANFGNAGAINNLIRVALQKAAMRPLTKDGFTRLLPEDIDTGEKKRDENVDPLSVLDKLYRMEKVKEQLVKIRNTFQVANDEGGEKPDLGHFVFRGAPGTGKTTVARAMADILYELGLIARNHVEETSGLDLTGDYVGQTKTKVQEKLDAARGGILFIDEAYELGKGIYGEEALTTILAAMTDPDYTLVIIIAGYPEDMENMLARNVGLKSRFTRYCDFTNWETKDCLEFLVNQAVKENFVMDVNSTPVINAGVSKIKSFPGWGNARDVKQLWKVIKEERADRVCNAPELEKTISVDDVTKAVNKMVEDRAPKVSEEQLKEDREKQMLRKLEEQFKLMSKDKTQTKEEERTEMKIEEIQEEPEEEVEEEEEDDADEGRDPGVPDDVWEELKRAKLKYAEEETQRRKQMEEIEKKMAQADDLEQKLKGDEAVEVAMKEMHKEEEKKAQEEAELVRKLQEELANEREAEKQRQIQLELEERRRKEEELRRKLAEERERQRLEAERLERIRLQIELERKRAEAAARKQREEELKRQNVQERLKQISNCPAGYRWNKAGGGWRCGGGSHFVFDAQLRDQFTHDV